MDVRRAKQQPVPGGRRRHHRSGSRVGRRAVSLAAGMALLATTVAVLAGGPPAHASAGVGVITLFAGPSTVKPFQEGIAAGPDGNMWFTTTDAGTGTPQSIGRITPAGVITTFTDPSIKFPMGITTGPDGNVWFTNYNGYSIGRITPAGVVSSFTGAGIDGPFGITPGPDGNLWFANYNGYSIGRITPAGVVSTFTGPGISFPRSIAAGADGNLWFTNNNDSSIGRITTAGVVTTFRAAGIDYPTGIAAGPDGNIWFVNRGGVVSSIGRITPAGAVTIFTDPTIVAASEITAGMDGNLWFTNSGQTIGRITTSGVVSSYSHAGIAGTRGIAAGPDGNVWFANAFTTGPGFTIGRIGTGLPDAPSAVSAQPSDGLATVSWRAPKSSPAVVTGYVVTPRIGGVAQTPRVFDSIATTQMVTGLANGTTYTFEVAAIDAYGRGPSALSEPTTVGTPYAPSAFLTADLGDHRATLSWWSPDVDFAPVTGSVITPVVGGVAQPPRTFNSPASTQTVTGLVDGTTYTFRVAATNVYGTGPYATVTATVGAPGKPWVFLRAQPGTTTAQVSWWAPPANGSPITGYRITPFTGWVPQPAVTVSATARSATLTGLTTGAVYTFYVTALNAFGTSGAAHTSSITVGAPASPASVQATGGAGQATVSWSPAAPNAAPVSGYTVITYIGWIPQFRSQFASTATTQTITGLTAGVTYTFHVEAINAVGSSPISIASPAVTPS